MCQNPTNEVNNARKKTITREFSINGNCEISKKCSELNDADCPNVQYVLRNKLIHNIKNHKVEIKVFYDGEHKKSMLAICTQCSKSRGE